MKKKESYDTIKKKEGGRGAELMSLLIGLYCKLKDVTVTFSLFLSATNLIRFSSIGVFLLIL